MGLASQCVAFLDWLLFLSQMILGPSTSLHGLLAHFFSGLNNIPLSGWIQFIYSFILLPGLELSVLEGYKFCLNCFNRHDPVQIAYCYCLSLANCVFPGIGSFHLGYQICQRRVVHGVYSFNILAISLRSVMMSSHSFLILVISIFFYYPG